MKSIILMIAVVLCIPEKNIAQLNIQAGAKVNMQGNAVVTATGNVISAAPILGTGTLVMNGTSLQQLQTSALPIPNLTIKNPSNILLSGNIRVNGVLNFVSGKIIANNFSVFLGETASITGAGTGKFVETIGSGQLRKLLNANITNYLLAIGSGSNYTPVEVTVSGSYTAAYIAARARPMIHPNKPAGATNYLNTYWSVSRSGVTGSVNSTATYTAANIVGNEATLRGYLWNGMSWTKTGVVINTTTNRITAAIEGTGGDIYAMNDVTLASASQLEEINSNGLYPNPTTSTSTIAFDIEADALLNISVYDTKGRLLQSKQLTVKAGYQQHKIDLSNYKPGVYDIQVRSSSFNKSYKLIKQ